MKNFRNRTISRPKVTTMPRNRSEASTQLELYKMVAERQRIHREINFIKERMTTLQKRLDVLNYQIGDTEKTINQLRHNDSINQLRHNNSIFVESVVPPNIVTESNNYQTFEMEY